MRDRPVSSARAGRSAAISLDLVLCTPRGRHLAVLLVRPGAGAARPAGRWALPRAPFPAGWSLDEAAAEGAAHARGARAAWLAQVGAFGDATRRTTGASISVAYVGVMPATALALPAGVCWFPAGELPSMAAGHRAIIEAALGVLRERMDHAPIAFRLLPPAFTLSELQGVYELLLGRLLHKASFRRALQAAYLVAPTDSWRSEGRGRPAQLFRFAPRRRRGGHRGVRFERLGG